MSSSVFVRDAQGTPLMPTSAAYARRLIATGKARWVAHHAFSVLQLTQVVEQPILRPIVIGLSVHLRTAELLLLADAERAAIPILRVVVDLRTDLPMRLRRRAMHRRHRRARHRYRAPRPHGISYKLRRPSIQRSRWRTLSRHRAHPLRVRRRHISPTMRWRAQAITRVIGMLGKLLPISHAVILLPAELRDPYRVSEAAQLRQQLIDTYGQVASDGSRRAMCAYCLTTEGRIEAEHIIPVSRGGTDGWQNRVLACAACNARKGDCLPEEAGMPLRIAPTGTPAAPNRAGSYARSTARLLIESLSAIGIPTRPRLQADDPRDHWPVELCKALLKICDSSASLPVILAKPIARPTKQVFTSRNYPLVTRLRPGMVRLRQTIRRRVRVNRALTIEMMNGRRVVRTISADEPIPAGVSQIVMLGMLCQGLRRERNVTGIVVAIHSAGRLTLLVPHTVDATDVQWRRVVVSPRRRLLLLSTDRVIFMRLPST